jgi:outer membrane receptor protein involved in Fe transport
VQGWLFDSDLSNISIAVSTPPGGPDRSIATPSNDQYKTPALGLGLNAALLGVAGNFHWEVGADMRDDSGASHELYQFTSGAYQSGRIAGGRSIVAGLYGEAALDLDAWLLTAGARMDYWATSQGHLLQYALSSGATTLNNVYPGRDGTVPTARLGARRNFSDDEFLRFAAYAGFRAPTLNELYRPGRVGNTVMKANADLNPEKLYGVEAGWGGTTGNLTWDATAFWNQLHNAIANVTVFPTVLCGPPPVSQCLQRKNIGNIDALGLEGEATEKLGDTFALRGAMSLTDARVHPGATDPLIAGKRPAQDPIVTATAGAVWQPIADWRFDADVRWVGAQFEDDLNTLKLGSAFVADLRAEWQFRENLMLFAAVDNIADSNVNTGETSFEPQGNGVVPVVSLGAPRTFEVGLTYAE